MIRYLIRRSLLGGVTLLLITLVVYALIRHMPGTPLTVSLATLDPSKALTRAEEQRLVSSYGLDKPWHAGYATWIVKIVTEGDLGHSSFEKRPVADVIGARISPTLLLSGTSLALSYLLSMALGLYCSARAGKLDERVVSLGSYMLYSLPSFVAALALLTLFCHKLRGTIWELPLQGMTSTDHAALSPWGQVLDVLRHLVLPVACLTYGSLAYGTRFIKANMEEVVRQDYIRTARAKGASLGRVLIVHAFRNTLVPFVTLVGLSLPGLLGGAVVLEGIFGWPGMGQLFFLSVARRDYDVIMGMTLMFAVLTLLGQLLADLLYALVDPRITHR